MVRRENDKSNHYRAALSTVSLPDFDFKHTVLQPQEINHLDKLQWKQLPSVPRRRTSCTVMQKRSVLFLHIEAGENQPSTTQTFSEKKLSSLLRKKKDPRHTTAFPLQGCTSCIQCWLWHPDKPVYEADEYAPFSKEGTKRIAKIPLGKKFVLQLKL